MMSWIVSCVSCISRNSSHSNRVISGETCGRTYCELSDRQRDASVSQQQVQITATPAPLMHCLTSLRCSLHKTNTFVWLMGGVWCRNVRIQHPEPFELVPKTHLEKKKSALCVSASSKRLRFPPPLCMCSPSHSFLAFY